MGSPSLGGEKESPNTMFQLAEHPPPTAWTRHALQPTSMLLQ